MTFTKTFKWRSSTRRTREIEKADLLREALDMVERFTRARKQE